MTDSAQDRLARLETLFGRIAADVKRLERIAVLRHELDPVASPNRPAMIELESLVAEIRQTFTEAKGAG